MYYLGCAREGAPGSVNTYNPHTWNKVILYETLKLTSRTSKRGISGDWRNFSQCHSRAAHLSILMCHYWISWRQRHTRLFLPNRLILNYQFSSRHERSLVKTYQLIISLDQPWFHYIRRKKSSNFDPGKSETAYENTRILGKNGKSILCLALAGTRISSPPEIYSLSARFTLC